MSTTHDDAHLREAFLANPPRGVPGGTTRLPRRPTRQAPPVEADVSFVDNGFRAEEEARAARSDDGEQRNVPRLVHTPAATPWEALEVTVEAEWDEVCAAHRRLLIRWHPDRHVGETDEERRYAEVRLAEVNAAFNDLAARRRA